ncbi:unnamed protein product [Brassica oleracea var. botrytis]
MLESQGYRCRSCEMPSEAHVHCYTHRQGSLTISVKKLQDYLLPGEKEGKIWMWHRCMRCPRPDGFPPATLRVVMSDAAWGLSFGKFLELSFSNHAAASRVACCDHSLHRDCLRFYGFGNMVACFRYATIDVNSVYLPPSVLGFNYDNQDWIQRETNEVKEGQPQVDILELYQLRRQLIFQSYMWDHRLINASSLSKIESSDENEKVPLAKSQTLPEMNAGTNSLLSGSKVDQNPDGGSTDDTKVQKESDTNLDLNP